MNKSQLIKLASLILGFSLILSLMYFGVYSLMQEEQKPSHSVSCDIDKRVKTKLLQRAKEYFREEFQISSEHLLEVKVGEKLTTKLLKQHTVCSVYGKFKIPPAHIYMAFNASGDIFLLPNGFNRMIVSEDISLQDSDQVLSMTGLYLDLFYRGNIIILEEAMDIPFSEDSLGSDPHGFSEIINSPSIKETEDGYKVKLYSWRQIGGRLERWKIFVANSKRVKKKRDVIADFVGGYEVLN